MSQTLYDKYGGFATIQKVVHAFYERILETKSLDKYFKNVNMPKLMEHQAAFLCKVLGGPDNYTGKTLKAAHVKLNIDDAAFGTVAVLLKESLEEAGVEPADVTTIIGIVASTKGDIVSQAA